MLKLTVWLSRVITLVLMIILTMLTEIKLYAQKPENLTIEKVFHLTGKNYPLIKQRDLITKTKEYSVSNAAKGYLPVLSINGQATDQSEVTSFPFQIPVAG